MKRLILLFALSGVLALASCDSGGEDPPPPEPTETNEAPRAVVSASSETVEAGSEVTFDGSDSSDPDGDNLTYAWSFDGNASGETATHVFENAGEFTETLTVEDPDGATAADDVTVTVTRANGAPEASLSLSSTELEVGDELTADGSDSSDPDGDDLSYTIDFGDGNEANSAEATNVFETAGDYTVKLTVSDGELETTAEETVTVTEATTNVTVEAVGDDGENLSSPVELLDGSEVIAEGNAPLEARVPESTTELTARALEYDQDLELYREIEKKFTVSTGSVTLTQARVPHCSNPFDNDGDGLVGVWSDDDGNGIPTEGDSGDPGCSSESDDNEAHRVRTITSSGEGSDTTFVSSNPNHWKKLTGSFNFNKSIQKAVGNIFFSQDVKISSSEDDENFALQFTCGSTTHLSDIVEDDPSVNGWYTPAVTGIKPDFFAESTDCEFVRLHEAFVKNEPGGGNDDVIFLVPGHVSSRVISWAYEPDKVEANSSASAMTRSVTRSHDGSESSVQSTGYTDSERHR